MLDVAFVLAVTSVVAAALWATWRGLRGRAATGVRRAVRVLAIVLVALPLAGLGCWQLSNARGFQLAGALVDRVDTTDKVVAFTFDDGPTAQYTPEVIAALAAHDARGTFFVIGAQATAEPGALRQLVVAGHEIGNHTWDHPRLLAVSLAQVGEQIERTDAVIRAAGHEGAIHVRPPNGKRLLAASVWLASHDRTTVMWSLEPDSKAGIADDADAMRAHVVQNVRPGDIVLMHVMYPAREASRQALPLILRDLAAQGYRFVTVSELLALGR